MLNKIQRKRRIKLVQGKPNIKVGSTWLKNILFAILIFSITTLISYRIFDGGNSFHYLLTINEQNNETEITEVDINQLSTSGSIKDLIEKLTEDLQ
ncbi:MAG: hypothetical protein EBW69_01330, partial [Nitrosomonadales bacterium]|nr:hypothetical protein [Nitrosomonadales bacterium]